MSGPSPRAALDAWWDRRCGAYLRESAGPAGDEVRGQLGRLLFPPAAEPTLPEESLPLAFAHLRLLAGEELGVVLQEVRVGKRRRDALRAFSVRVQTPEASAFSRTLVQADRMGTGIAEALKVLSEDMRLQRYHWAERFAQQAPLKMLVPLLFSLAAALIIVAGPILGQFLQGGFSAPQFTLDAGRPQ